MTVDGEDGATVREQRICETDVYLTQTLGERSAQRWVSASVLKRKEPMIALMRRIACLKNER